MAKSINDLAAELNMTPRNIRKHWRAFVRANGGVIGQDTPGKGKRYTLDARTYSQFKKVVSKRAASEAQATVKAAPKATRKRTPSKAAATPASIAAHVEPQTASEALSE